MKKGLLFSLSISFCLGAMAQQAAEHFPNGFQRASIPSSMKNYSVKVPYRTSAIDNQVPDGRTGNPNPIAKIANPTTTSSSFAHDELYAGSSFYDLQTNNSISNRCCVNIDPNGSGTTVSMAWTFSPNSLAGTTPPYPSRGSAYNFWDGSNMLYPAGPALREETVRTGFTNIVVTPISEILIAHNASGSDNNIAVTRRTSRGVLGGWEPTVFPWSSTPSFDTWPKAVAASSVPGGSQNVYVIFQGSGAPAVAGDPPNIVAGQNGPIFFARSTDGGATWEPKRIIDLIDSNYYTGFGGDSYSIDAKDNVVAISYGDTYTDVGLLKSTDGGVSWTKTIIQRHPIPFYADCECGTFYIPNAQDTTVDTVYSNAGDSKVLIDNYGTCHVWFTQFNYHDDDGSDDLYNPHDGTDGLSYWTEYMGSDTGGARPYVTIASSQDFNNNLVIDVPSGATAGCTNRNAWGEFAGGATIMPSAGIDANGRIFLTYHALAEEPEADTGFYHIMRRHVYMMTLDPPYHSYAWTYPYDIIPDAAMGGDSYNQEGSFACMGRNVDANYAYVLYQRDGAPGHSLAADGTCDKLNNFGNSSDIWLTRMDVTTVGVQTNNSTDLFVSQNYPNPSTGTTYINLGLKKSTKVTLEVHDVVGKVVYRESKGTLTSGNHNISINTANWETGVYTYTVTAGGDKMTRQLIVQ